MLEAASVRTEALDGTRRVPATWRRRCALPLRIAAAGEIGTCRLSSLRNPVVAGISPGSPWFCLLTLTRLTASHIMGGTYLLKELGTTELGHSADNAASNNGLQAKRIRLWYAAQVL